MKLIWGATLFFCFVGASFNHVLPDFVRLFVAIANGLIFGFCLVCLVLSD